MTYNYHCVNKKCRKYQVTVETTMSPTDIRRATGSGHRCPHCGQTTRLLGTSHTFVVSAQQQGQ